MNPRYSRYYTFVKPLFRNQTVKTYNSFALSLVIITIFSLFAIRPTLHAIAGLQKQIEQQNQVLTQLNQKAQALTQAKSNLDSISSSDRAKIDDLLPSRTAPTTLAHELVNNANVYNASVSGIQYQDTDLVGDPPSGSTSANLAEINFAFNTSGGFSNLLALLNSLNSSSRLIDLGTLEMTKPEDSSITMTVNGKSYFLK